MAAYLLLVRPAANRVFAGNAADLTAAELAVVAGGTLTDSPTAEPVAGVEYVAFTGDPDLAAVARLSSAHALFERLDDGLLRPVPLPHVEHFDESLVTTQRYVGKTNEVFTRLILNLGIAAAGPNPGNRLRVFDPLCGRGTTLNHALTLGADAIGIDIDDKDTAAYATFLKTWLQDHRIKHQVDAASGRRRFRLSIGQKGAGHVDECQLVDVVTGDTTDAPSLFGRNAADVIATDLPYGVQHGASTGPKLSRRPDELLEAALPAWRSVLRPGGAAALSWNVRLLDRGALLAIAEAAGYTDTGIGADGQFEHRVDRVITRDVVVVRRPAN